MGLNDSLMSASLTEHCVLSPSLSLPLEVIRHDVSARQKCYANMLEALGSKRSRLGVCTGNNGGRVQEEPGTIKGSCLQKES